MANNQMKRSFSHMEMQTIPARGPEGEAEGRKKGKQEGREGGEKEGKGSVRKDVEKLNQRLKS